NNEDDNNDNDKDGNGSEDLSSADDLLDKVFGTDIYYSTSEKTFSKALEYQSLSGMITVFSESMDLKTCDFYGNFDQWFKKQNNKMLIALRMLQHLRPFGFGLDYLQSVNFRFQIYNQQQFTLVPIATHTEIDPQEYPVLFFIYLFIYFCFVYSMHIYIYVYTYIYILHIAIIFIKLKKESKFTEAITKHEYDVIPELFKKGLEVTVIPDFFRHVLTFHNSVLTDWFNEVVHNNVTKCKHLLDVLYIPVDISIIKPFFPKSFTKEKYWFERVCLFFFSFLIFHKSIERRRD
ncbi:hypothetical protein RFI_32899, partial [Reticulomyxa filosa]